MGDTQHAENPFKLSAPVADSLKTVSAIQLQKADIPPLRFIVDGLLPEGLSILAAPPKFGKSWFSLGLCLSVASGVPFLDHSTACADVLYLALEDSFRRLQSRQNQLLQGKEAPNNLHFAIAAGTLDGALSGQIETFLQAHPNTALIIIDVLARVRSQTTAGRTDAYRLDYSDMTVLKQLADKHHICILVVHHTRKMRDESDIFNDVSGSSGITGAADTAFILCKDKRSDTKAALHVIGRDVEAAELVIEMDEKCQWCLIGSAGDVSRRNAIREFCTIPLVRLIQKMLDATGEEVLRTTSDELKTSMDADYGTCGSQDSAKKIGRFLSDAENVALFREIGIECSSEKTATTRWRTFRRIRR